MKSSIIAVIAALLISETQGISITVDSLIVKEGQGEGGNAKTMAKTIIGGNFANTNCATSCCACSGAQCGGCPCPC